jgi:hypothetical protein
MASRKSMLKVVRRTAKLTQSCIQKKLEPIQVIQLPKNGKLLLANPIAEDGSSIYVPDDCLISYEVVIVGHQQMLRVPENRRLSIMNTDGIVLFETSLIPVTHVGGELALEIPKLTTKSVTTIKYSELRFDLVPATKTNHDVLIDGWKDAYASLHDQFAVQGKNITQHIGREIGLSATYDSFDWKSYRQELTSSSNSDNRMNKAIVRQSPRLRVHHS